MIFPNFSNVYEKDQNLIDSRIFWDFATNIFEIFGKCSSKRYYQKEIRIKLEVRNKSLLTRSWKKHTRLMERSLSGPS